MQLVCSSCGAVNRAPEGKDPRAAKCGRCHKPMLTGQPIEVTGDSFAVHRRSTKGLPLLVDIWAPWCGPCQSMAPHFARAAVELEPRVRLLKLNSDEAPQVSAELGVRGIPTLVLFLDGKVLAQQAGAMSSQQIVAWTTQALARAAAA